MKPMIFLTYYILLLRVFNNRTTIQRPAVMGWEITRYPKVIVRENRRQGCVKNVMFLLKIEQEKNVRTLV